MDRTAAAVLLAACLAGVASAQSTYSLHRHTPAVPPSHTARRRRRLEVSSRRRLEVDDTSLFGDVDTLGYYYAYLHIGTPPQKQTVIVDTGSSLVAVPCSDCTACGKHMDAPYDVTKSSTGRELKCDHLGSDDRDCMETTKIHSDDWGCNGQERCEFTLSYTEGSRLQGHFVEDVVCINDHPCDLDADLLPKIRFGCADVMGGLFRSQKADGIMGLGWGAEAALEPLRANNSREHATLQLCLTHGGGFMTVGDGDLDVQQIRKEGKTEWTRMQSKGSKPFFRVTTAMLTVDKAQISGRGYSLTTNDPGIDTILDSGSTYSYLPDGIWRKMQNTFKEYCQKDGHCKSKQVKKDPTSLHCTADNRYLSTYPDITIYFSPGSNRRVTEGDDMPQIKLHPEQYFFPYLGSWCVGFIRDPNLDRIELGANSLLDHLVTFDPEKHMVGFTKADCDNKKAIKRRMKASSAAVPEAPAAAAAPTAKASGKARVKVQAALNLQSSGGHVGHVGLNAAYLVALLGLAAVAAVALRRERASARQGQRQLLVGGAAPQGQYRSYAQAAC